MTNTEQPQSILERLDNLDVRLEEIGDELDVRSHYPRWHETRSAIYKPKHDALRTNRC